VFVDTAALIAINQNGGHSYLMIKIHSLVIFGGRGISLGRQFLAISSSGEYSKCLAEKEWGTSSIRYRRKE